MASCRHGCNTSEKEKNWHKFPPTMHRFMKILKSGDFEHKLRIPKKFTKCSKGKISRWCKLTAPSGKKWRVKTRKESRDIYFADGWELFVRSHCLKARDSLVFSYTGESTFSVSIFNGATECEDEDSYFTENTSSSSCMHCRSTLDDHEDYSFGSEVEHVSSDDGEDSTFDLSEEEEEDEEEEEEEKKPRRAKNRAIRGVSTSRAMYYVSNRRPVTQEEIERARDFAEGYRCRNEHTGVPMVQIKMLRSHVYSGFHLTIPQEWALKHMLQKSHDVELRVHGGQKIRWEVGCRWNRARQCQLRPNWPKFVFDNCLEEHDVCVFELVRQRGEGTGNPLFYVHIFRVVANPVPLTIMRRNM